MYLNFGGQSEIKTRATRRVGGRPQAAVMRFNDRSADGESHAGPVKLGGKERIKDMLRLLRGQPHSRITDGHNKVPVFSWLGLDGKVACSIRFSHRLNTVQDEVHHDLLQLHAIAHDMGKVRRQLRPNGYRVSHCFVLQEDEHLAYDFV